MIKKSFIVSRPAAVLAMFFISSLLVSAPFALAASPTVGRSGPKPGTVSSPIVVSLPVIAAPLPVTNPLSGSSLFVSSATQVQSWINANNSSRSADAQTLRVIANQPQATWFGNWNSNIQNDVSSLVTSAATTGTTPILVLYNIPSRDCGSFSAGGSANAAAYRTWISQVTAGIAGKSAIVILEPDALANIDCLDAAGKTSREQLLKDAVATLKTGAHTTVYLDAGNAHWIGADEMKNRLNASGIAQTNGFSLNVSNYFTTSDSISYGTQLSSLLGNKHFVIDTSRNGKGSTPDNAWCNPSGRALGNLPTTSTGNALVDAFLWIKTPGESDGACNGGPSAGVFWLEGALALVRNR